MEEKRALVVEDDPDGRAALRELLREWGYAVEEAADGAGALALVRTQRPDVIVLDLWRGGREGGPLEVIARIRADDERAFVVVFSGWHHMQAATLAAGADAYVLKPDVDELQRLLDRPTAPRSQSTRAPRRSSGDGA